MTKQIWKPCLPVIQLPKLPRKAFISEILNTACPHQIELPLVCNHAPHTKNPKPELKARRFNTLYLLDPSISNPSCKARPKVVLRADIMEVPDKQRVIQEAGLAQSSRVSSAVVRRRCCGPCPALGFRLCRVDCGFKVCRDPVKS